MKGIFSLAGLLLLVTVQSSWQFPLLFDSSVMSDDMLFTDPATRKRHSEGTFSNDYSKYLETRRAQDFVQWLMNSKRSIVRKFINSDCITLVYFLADGSTYLQNKLCFCFCFLFLFFSVKLNTLAFISTQTRRHADGTYTSDVSSYLRDQVAKEFVSWLKTARGRRE
uniref:Glucagon b n=1 Tax=Electrophorus electricus TaxID=8005 RepID=A0A4W4HNY4_ELEEL